MTKTVKNSNKSIDMEALICSYKDCKDEKKRRMLHLAIVEKCMYLVRKIAGTVSAQSGVAVEDLVQVGFKFHIFISIKKINGFNQPD